MKINIAFIFFIILWSFLLASCSSGNPTEDNRNVPVYNTPMPVVTSPPLNVQPPADTNPQPTPAGRVEDTAIYEFISGFAGINTHVPSPKQHNSPLALIGGHMQLTVICYDYDTDTLYYINRRGESTIFNWENDSFLYSYKNGVNQVVVEMPVNFPVYHDGIIYFTSYDNLNRLYGWTEWYPGGYIYTYTINTGSVELYVPTMAYGLIVYDDYLYFFTPCKYEGEVRISDRFRVPLAGGEPENTGELLPFYYGEYQLKLLTDASGRQSLVLHSSQNTITVIEYHSLTDFPFWVDFRDGRFFCVYGDYLFFRYLAGWVKINLRNGASALLSHFNKDGEQIRIMSIVVLENETYVKMEGVLYKHNYENNVFEPINISNFDDFRFMQNLQTDGKHLYTTISGSGSRGGQVQNYIMQISRTEDGQYEGKIINH
jgi:hypothetical protein